jgi:hypothetical protein
LILIVNNVMIQVMIVATTIVDLVKTIFDFLFLCRVVVCVVFEKHMLIIMYFLENINSPCTPDVFNDVIIGLFLAQRSTNLCVNSTIKSCLVV